MAVQKNPIYAIRNIIKQIDDKIEDISTIEKEIPQLICETFVIRARNRLQKLNNAVDQTFINKLLGNIYTRNSYNKWQVIIRENEEGIMHYLEYGTGLVGESEPHPLANMIQWEYAINESNYKNYNFKRGWFFSDTSHYIDRDDIAVPSKKYPNVTKSIFSNGIKPVRYIYDTALEVEDVIRRAKGNYKLMKTMLEALKVRKI